MNNEPSASPPRIRFGSGADEAVASASDDMRPFPQPRLIRWLPKWSHRISVSKFRLVISQGVLEDVNKAVGMSLEREIGGFLLGNIFTCPNEGIQYVMIDQYSPAQFTEETAVSLMFTAASWSQLAEDRAGKFLGKRLVGWYHSHPRMDVFLSQTDVELHTQRFPQPWMTALVITPDKAKGGFFVWEDSALDRQNPTDFYEYLEGEATTTRISAMGWAGHAGFEQPPGMTEVKARSPRLAARLPALAGDTTRHSIGDDDIHVPPAKHGQEVHAIPLRRPIEDVVLAWLAKPSVLAGISVLMVTAVAAWVLRGKPKLEGQGWVATIACLISSEQCKTPQLPTAGGAGPNGGAASTLPVSPLAPLRPPGLQVLEKPVRVELAQKEAVLRIQFRVSNLPPDASRELKAKIDGYAASVEMKPNDIAIASLPLKVLRERVLGAVAASGGTGTMEVNFEVLIRNQEPLPEKVLVSLGQITAEGPLVLTAGGKKPWSYTLPVRVPNEDLVPIRGQVGAAPVDLLVGANSITATFKRLLPPGTHELILMSADVGWRNLPLGKVIVEMRQPPRPTKVEAVPPADTRAAPSGGGAPAVQPLPQEPSLQPVTPPATNQESPPGENRGDAAMTTTAAKLQFTRGKKLETIATKATACKGSDRKCLEGTMRDALPILEAAGYMHTETEHAVFRQLAKDPTNADKKKTTSTSS